MPCSWGSCRLSILVRRNQDTPRYAYLEIEFFVSKVCSCMMWVSLASLITYHSIIRLFSLLQVLTLVLFFLLVSFLLACVSLRVKARLIIIIAAQYLLLEQSPRIISCSTIENKMKIEIMKQNHAERESRTVNIFSCWQCMKSSEGETYTVKNKE